MHCCWNYLSNVYTENTNIKTTTSEVGHVLALVPLPWSSESLADAESEKQVEQDSVQDSPELASDSPHRTELHESLDAQDSRSRAL